MHTSEIRISELIIQLHKLSKTMEPSINARKVRLVADQLAIIGNEYHEEMEKTKMYDTSKFVTGL